MELLVVIGILVVIWGLSLTTLSEARGRARLARCSANLAQHGRMISVYAGSWQDRTPYLWLRDGGRSQEFRGPAGDLMRSRLPDGGLTGYLLASKLWHLPLLDMLNDDALHASVVCEADPSQRRARASGASGVHRVRTLIYTMSGAMVLHPSGLDPRGHALTQSRYWTGRSLGDVMFPSVKTLVFEGAPLHEPWFVDRGRLADRPWRIASVNADGSAAYRRLDEATPGVTPLAPAWGHSEQARHFSLHLTPWGVRGRDWR